MNRTPLAVLSAFLLAAAASADEPQLKQPPEQVGGPNYNELVRTAAAGAQGGGVMQGGQTATPEHVEPQTGFQHRSRKIDVQPHGMGKATMPASKEKPGFFKRMWNAQLSWENCAGVVECAGYTFVNLVTSPARGAKDGFLGGWEFGNNIPYVGNPVFGAIGAVVGGVIGAAVGAVKGIFNSMFGGVATIGALLGLG